MLYVSPHQFSGSPEVISPPEDPPAGGDAGPFPSPPAPAPFGGIGGGIGGTAAQPVGPPVGVEMKNRQVANIPSKVRAFDYDWPTTGSRSLEGATLFTNPRSQSILDVNRDHARG